MRRMYDSGSKTDADKPAGDERDILEAGGWQGSLAPNLDGQEDRPVEHHEGGEAWPRNLGSAEPDMADNSWLRRDSGSLEGWRSALDGEEQPAWKSRHREALTDIARAPWTDSGTGLQRRPTPRFLQDEPEGERPAETVWAGAEPESEFDVPLGRDYVAEARLQRPMAPRQPQPEPRRQANLSDRIKAQALRAPHDDGPARDLEDILNPLPASRVRRPAPRPARKSRTRILRTAALATTFCLSAGAGIGIYLMLQQESPAPISEALDPVRTLLAPTETPAPAKPVQKAAIPEKASDASNVAPPPAAASQPPKASIATLAPSLPKPAPALALTPVSTGEQATAGKPPVQQKKVRKIETARLEVRDVQGEAKEFIPLGVRFVPSGQASDSSLRITGLPRDAILTAGQRAEDGSWTLKAGEEKGVRLVVPFADQPKRFDVSVEAIDTRAGALQAPVREMRVSILPDRMVISPAAAPATTARNFVGELEPGPAPKAVESALATGPGPELAAEGTPPDAPEAPPAPSAERVASLDAGEVPAAPEPAAQEPAEAEPAQAAGSDGSTTASTDSPQLAALQPPADDPPAVESENFDPMQPPAETGGIVPSDPVVGLIARGDELLALGDVIAARRLYERAVDMGHQPAAAKLARTYDPVVFKKLNVQGMLPDPDKALQWYRHAEKAGVDEVAADIAALNNWLKQ